MLVAGLVASFAFLAGTKTRDVVRTSTVVAEILAIHFTARDFTLFFVCDIIISPVNFSCANTRCR